MNMEADLQGILSLLRRHIEIRNRSWMKRIHRDCFIGSEAVDFLVTQGLADTREIAVNLCRKMAAKDMIKKVTDTQKNFSDSYHYYRFKEDDVVGSALGDNNAGNSNGTATGQGGCKWSFAPHTAHNSYVLGTFVNVPYTPLCPYLCLRAPKTHLSNYTCIYYSRFTYIFR